MKKYDLVIAGGGTAGCAAAYTAGKLGLKTLIIEKNIHLGGSITSGLVIPAMDTGKNLINTDFYNLLCEKMHEIGGQITYKNNPGWLNPELLKIVLDTLLSESGVDILFGASIDNVFLKDKHIQSIILKNEILSPYNYSIQNNQKILSEPIETRYVIDATGNCEIGKLCGCYFLETKDEVQPVSLRFIMSGIDLKTFSEWLLEYDKDRDVTTVEYIDDAIHLSTAYTWESNKNWALKPLFDDALVKNILKDTDRNYFQIFSIAGMPESIAFNCPRITDNIDLENCNDISNSLISARASIYRISEFCKHYFPGFQNAYISNIADSLGIRVSRRIKGKYVYTIDDLRSGKKFDNPVLISNYPVDVHSSQKDSSILENNGEYQLPVESLMTNDIDNIFVVGRCISADFLSQGALRVQPNCFSMGEGLVKYIKKYF